jgi:hypothetical protein
MQIQIDAPTVDFLRQSALELVERMIGVQP